MRVDRSRLRQLSFFLGVGTTIVGIGPWLAPRWFARATGLALGESPVADVAIRSVSARDAISGVGIISATIHGGRVAPWVLARGLADATDVVAIAVAWQRGARDPRMVGLGVVAFAAAVFDFILYAGWKLVARTPEQPAGR